MIRNAFFLLLAGLIVLACAQSFDVGERGVAPDPGGPGFGPPDGSSDDGGEGGNGLAENLCIGTECPLPYATCGASSKCTVNLSNDEANCGECGNDCPDLPDVRLVGSCIEGRCLYECSNTGKDTYRNCNNLLEDGCETNTASDPLNCGTCGHSCAPGEHCFFGVCGCPSGLTDCNGTCIDLESNVNNCGSCGRQCPEWAEAGWPEPPPHMVYACSERECGRLSCIWPWANCDGDLSNGCEIDTAIDVDNCKSCGVHCATGQTCGILDATGEPACICEDGLTDCTQLGSPRHRCDDLLHNIHSCGACGHRCEVPPRGNNLATCNQGRCESACLPGFADCDGDPRNGCETNLKVDPSNCGTCNNWCNTRVGQPCVEGQCLLVGCDSGAPVTK